MCTVNFTLGENFGELLTEIAIEKLYDFNIPGALSTFSDSLGCSDSVSRELLLGNYILRVQDKDKCICNAIPREEDYNESNYPTINFERLQLNLLKLFQNPRYEEYEVVFQNFLFDIQDVEEKLFTNPTLEFDGSYLELLPNTLEDGINFYGTFEIKYRKLVEHILNNDRSVIDLIEDNDLSKDYSLFSRTYYTINKVKTILEKKDQILEVADFIENYWPDHKPQLRKNLERYISRIILFLEKVNNVLSGKIEFVYEPVSIIDKHIKAALEIDKALKEFSPVCIEDNYSAGWLSPGGEFFGLNGEVSNCLHIHLADAIFEYYKWPDPEFGQSKDDALDCKGFVKIHGQEILFSGYSFEILGRAPRRLTQRQIDKICDYGRSCWNGKLSFGYSKKFVDVNELDDYTQEQIEKLFE